jgi:hypothetical protein
MNGFNHHDCPAYFTFSESTQSFHTINLYVQNITINRNIILGSFLTGGPGLQPPKPLP